MIPEWALPGMVEQLMRAECELKLARLSKSKDELMNRLGAANVHLQTIRNMLVLPQ